jgi:hypothetical protein
LKREGRAHRQLGDLNSLVYILWKEFEIKTRHKFLVGASLSDNDVDCYVIVRKLLDSVFSTRWELKSNIQGDFSSVELSLLE